LILFSNAHIETNPLSGIVTQYPILEERVELAQPPSEVAFEEFKSVVNEFIETVQLSEPKNE
jgi:hypothetical protein